MSYSAGLVHGTSLSLNSKVAGNFRTQRRTVVCCCPWSGSDMADNKYEKTSSGYSKVNFESDRKNNGNSPPLPLSDAFLTTMENQFPFNLITFPPLLGPFSSTTKRGPVRHRLPPGPSLLDLIGLSHYFIRSFPYHYPLRDLANIYGPLMHMKLGERSIIVVSSPDMAKEVLKTHDLACADRPKTMTGEVMCYNYTDILFSPYGHYWREMRKVCNSELLGPKRIQSFEHIRREEASVMIESIESTRGLPFNLTEQIVLCIGSMISRALFGQMAEDKGTVNSALRKVSMDKDGIIKSVKKATTFAGNLYLPDLFPSIELLNMISWDKFEMLKMRRDTERILDYMIDEHRKNRALTGKGYGEFGTEDFLDVLLRLKESGEADVSITDDNIKAVISDMSVGGSETVLTTLDWAMAELMKNPCVMAKAQDEIRQAFKRKKTIQESDMQTLNYLKLVVKETLRLHPPNCIIPRACREEFEVNGYHIPLNAAILVNIWAIGRDPNYWPDPESFKPERFEEKPIDFGGNHFEYLPFGSGKRVCPGIAFAMANIEFVLAQLLYHFDWKLPDGIRPDDVDMTESDGAAVSRKTALYLFATPYDPNVSRRQR